MKKGEASRAIAEHALNAGSTRSHCIFTLHLEMKIMAGTKLNSVHSKLNVVDLAGSERVKTTNSTGQLLVEARHINKSLTFLEQVVVALGDRQRQHIPYRQSKLTSLLKDSLGGNCRTLLIACIWLDRMHTEQTLSTLRFGTRMMRIANKPIRNLELDRSEQVKVLEAEVALLKKEISMYDAVHGNTGVTHSPLSVADKGQLEQIVQEFVEKEKEPEFVSLRQMSYIMHSLRNRALSGSGNGGSGVGVGPTQQSAELELGSGNTNTDVENPGDGITYVGEIEDNNSGAIGVDMGYAPIAQVRLRYFYLFTITLPTW
jgi:kinesin family protein 6/9